MKLKNYVILTLFFSIIIIGITTVSATNFNDTCELSENSNNIIQQNNEINYESTLKETKNIKSDSIIKKENKQTVSNFNELNTQFNNIKKEEYDDEYTIILNSGDYTFNNTLNWGDSGQKVKNITLIGNSNTSTKVNLNGNNTYQLFTVSKNYQLNIINLTLNQGLANSGGAINNNGTLNIVNSSFNNNTVKGLLNYKNQGGSIYNSGTLTINNSNFNNNFADYGGAIYNVANSTIENTVFTENTINMVGGTIYNLRSNLTLINCTFIGNSAVSGGGIYNSYGTVKLNKINFLQNEAYDFFGGAIYNTGIMEIQNSNFTENVAFNYDGGAITNTGQLGIINCNFKENTAGETGGAIHNIKWATDKGNITITNSTFIENSVVSAHGGAIANHNGTITIISSLFKDNTAQKGGGALYNDCILNVTNSVFIDNQETIYNTNKVDAENNWWATNNPDWEMIGVTPNNWIIVTIENTTMLLDGYNSTIKVILKLNNNEQFNRTIPEIPVKFEISNGTFNHNELNISNTIINQVYNPNGIITIKINDQIETIIVPEIVTITKLINNGTTLNVISLVNPRINGVSTIKVNDKTQVNKLKVINGTLTYNLPISTWTNSQYKLSVLIQEKGQKTLKTEEIIKLDVLKTIVTIKPVVSSPRKTVLLEANIKDVNGNVINTGKVCFKINGKTIKTNVNIVNGKAIINYTIPSNWSYKTYKLTVVYGGHNRLERSDINSTLTLIKPDI
ncbi:MAG: hypothetical protein Q4Q23_02605 [Methanobacteriaceae archaeon]|nr:hypothetical protein [Methanobacteriaceae archaeon]